MPLNQLQARLQGILHGYQGKVVSGQLAKKKGTALPPSSSRGRIHRRTHHYYQHRGQNQHQQHHQQQRRNTTGLDVARFGLLSIATLPFSLWVAMFSYDYYNRIPICEDALALEDDDIAYIRFKGRKKGALVGKERQLQLKEVQNLLSSPPHQIVVVAGTNESGKSRFVEETLNSLPLSRGVTYINLGQNVDSVSTLTYAFVRAFDLRWLKMRHSLVDVLPFAGSEILVMKERFSDRDLTQALMVITEALKSKGNSYEDPHNRPVIVIDGLGEGSSWIRSSEGQRAVERLIKWCIYITKERKLAHVVLTGNEELVIGLTGQNRLTRGHVKVVGLGDLTMEEAGEIVLQELPDATPAEIEMITDIFGGFIHDVQAVSREVQSWLNYRHSNQDVGSRRKIFEHVLISRFRLQLERVTAAFAKGRDESDDDDSKCAGSSDPEDEMDPYLDPLKAIYSEAEASQKETAEAQDESQQQGLLSDSASWSQLQLWHTLQRLVDSGSMTVPFADLRDEVFDGNMTPLIELMHEDVIGFQVESSSESGWSWVVTPATPCLGRVFEQLVSNSHLKERFQDIQRVEESREKVEEIERERRKLRRERKRLDIRKASLLKTVELQKELRVRTSRSLHNSLQEVYCSMVEQEVSNEQKELALRKELEKIAKAKAAAKLDNSPKNASSTAAAQHERGGNTSNVDHTSIQQHLKTAILRSHTQETSKNKFSRFRHAFEHMASNTGGVTAQDVVRLIKETSGEDIDVKAAEAFIRTWDLNQDKILGYDEFITMLLTDPKAVKRNTISMGRRW